MDFNEKQQIALYRYAIIAPLVTNTAMEDYKSNNAFFKNASSKITLDYKGHPTEIAPSTIKAWYLSYQKNGFDSLMPKSRSDNKKFRKIDNEIIEKVKYYKKEYPKLPCTMIYDKLVETGTIKKDEISLSTLNRYVNSIKRDEEYDNQKKMLRYEKQFINELWCGDSSVGPYLRTDSGKVRTYIIALIDDASRFIVGCDIFFEDNYVNLLSVIRSAVIKYGKPQKFNFDNGSNYRSHQMGLLSARLGSVINYNPVHTPTSIMWSL